MASTIAPISTKAKVFRYRYVAFGTRFTSAPGFRAPGDEANPSTLYANELAVDVGGRAFAIDGETAAVFDHHFGGAERPPCAAVAVLQRANAIAARFGDCEAGVIWLVAHRDADFDALCALYLARWAIAEREPVDVPAGVDWFSPRAGALVPRRVRWAFQLAGYAACVDHARRLYCARNEALHSVLYAALARGRPYLDAESGALEFFTEVRARLEAGANPQSDSVLASSATFAPELAMLRRENELYELDMARARTAVVFVPIAPDDFEAAYARACARPLPGLGDAPSELSARDDRLAVDGVYLRDPECLLFKEWARLDRAHSTLGRGFTFTCIAVEENGGGRVAYYASLDPEFGHGLHLYPVWERLQRREAAALRAARCDPAAGPARAGFESRAGDAGALFADPWYDGGTYACQIVVSPNGGSAIGPAGRCADLADDPVAAEIRAELEDWAFAGAIDVHPEPAPADAPADSPAYRFGRVEIRDAVDVLNDATALQLGGQLWCALFGTADRVTSADVIRARTYRRNGLLAVWNRAGVAVAHVAAMRGAADRLEAHFRQIVDVAGELDGLCERRPDAGDADAIARRVDAGELLMASMGALRRELAADDGEVIEGFIADAGIERVLQTFRDVNRAGALKQQTRQMLQHTRTVADVQSKVEWLEILFVAVYATEAGNIIFGGEHGTTRWSLLATMVCAVVATGAAVMYLRPWEHVTSEGKQSWVATWLPLLIVGAMFAVGIALGWCRMSPGGFCPPP
jgi:hypothetical protein